MRSAAGGERTLRRNEKDSEERVQVLLRARRAFVLLQMRENSAAGVRALQRMRRDVALLACGGNA